MVEDKKVPEGYKNTDIGIIPEDWECKKLGDLGECIIGLTYKPENIKEDGLLVLRSSNIDENRLKFNDNVYVNVDVNERLLVNKDDLLICVRNGSRNLIGKCALIDEKTAGSTFGAFMSVYKSPYSKYVYNYFQTDYIKRQINENMGATINQITNKNLNSFLIAIPNDDSEQQAIAEALSDVDNLITSLEKFIDKKQKIKQGTMQELLIGKKRLPGFTEEWENYELRELLDYEQPTNYIVQTTEYTEKGTPVLTAGKSFILGYTRETQGIYTDYPVIIFDDFTTGSKYVTFSFKVKSSAMKMLKLKNPQNSLKLIYEIMQMIKFPLIDHQRYWISEYCKLKVKLPKNIEEQQAIAKILNDMDAEIESLGKKLDKYKAIKLGMMQELLTGRIRLI